MLKILRRSRQGIIRLCIILMLLAMYFGCVTSAQAKTLSYIQCSLDINNWEILTCVVRENLGITAHSPEVRRVDSAVLQTLASNSDSLANAKSALSGLSGYVTGHDNNDNYDGIKVNGNWFGGLIDSGEANRVLTFPGKGVNSRASDHNRAMEVNDSLIYYLNQSFALWLDAKGYSRTPNLEDFYNRISEFLNSLVISGDKCTVPGVDGEFRWRIAKGYTTVGHIETLRNIPQTADADYINWGMIVYEAFNNFLLEGDEAVTEQTVYAANPGQMEKALVAFFNSMLDGLRGVLGFWSIDEIMFNTNNRSVGYAGGIFPNSWEPVIWAMFIIAEVLAAMMLMYGIINNVLRKATSTMNTFARLRAMEQIQDIFICAVALALLPLILRILISLSADFTSMIYTLVPEDNAGNKVAIAKMVSGYSSASGTIGGVIAQFMFFGVQVYFNFFYMLRSLMVAFLIIIAPVMISMIMVSNSKKQMAVLWAKELMANILIQPIHAFIMTTILLLPNSFHGFDNIIALYALIPLTAAMRNMFFGGAGSMMDRAADNAKGKLTGALGRGASAAGSAALTVGGTVVGSYVGSKLAGGNGKGGGSNGNGIASGNTGGASGGGNNNSASGSGGADGTASQSGGNSGSGQGGTASGGDNAPADGTPADLPNTATDANRAGGKNTLAKAWKATKAASAIGLAAFGGALSGAGMQGGAGFTSLGMDIIKPKMPGGGGFGSFGGNSVQGQGAGNTNHNLSQEPPAEEAVELGRSKSGFEDMGEVSLGDFVKQRYSASNAALENMGISNLNESGGEFSFNADPCKSPETAELGAYADYCQYLSKNGMGAERAALQKATGISATKTDSSLKVTVNKSNWRKTRNSEMPDVAPKTGFSKMGSNIRLGATKTGEITGMHIEGPLGMSQSLLGGINTVAEGESVPHAVSFAEVMKKPEAYKPEQYTPKCEVRPPDASKNPEPPDTPDKPKPPETPSDPDNRKDGINGFEHGNF